VVHENVQRAKSNLFLLISDESRISFIDNAHRIMNYAYSLILASNVRRAWRYQNVKKAAYQSTDTRNAM